MVNVMVVVVVMNIRGSQVLMIQVHRDGPHQGETVMAMVVRCRSGGAGQGSLRVGARGHVHMHAGRRSHPSRRRPHGLSPTWWVVQKPIVCLWVVKQPVEDGNPKGRCALRKHHLHVGCVKWRGVVDQHTPQAEVNKVVPSIVPGGTIIVQTCLELSVRVPPMLEEVGHCVHHTTVSSSEVCQLDTVGRDSGQRQEAHKGLPSYGEKGRRGGGGGGARLRLHVISSAGAPRKGSGVGWGTRALRVKSSTTFPLPL